MASIATAAVALGLVPALAGAQGAGQYLPSEPPQAPGNENPTPSQVTPSGGETDTAPSAGSGSSTGTAPAGDEGAAAAADTVTESSGADAEQLPVTGLPAAPLAIAGLVLLMSGFGLRRASGRHDDGRPDEDDPSGTRRILGR